MKVVRAGVAVAIAWAMLVALHNLPETVQAVAAALAVGVVCGMVGCLVEIGLHHWVAGMGAGTGEDADDDRFVDDRPGEG